MPPVGFEPTISAGKRPQTYALDRAATGTGIQNALYEKKMRLVSCVILKSRYLTAHIHLKTGTCRNTMFSEQRRKISAAAGLCYAASKRQHRQQPKTTNCSAPIRSQKSSACRAKGRIVFPEDEIESSVRQTVLFLEHYEMEQDHKSSNLMCNWRW